MLLNIPIELFLGIIISLIGLISGSITDLKKREVPDWINYSLVFSGFFLALIVSIIKNDFLILLHSLFGFLFFFIIGVLMFYTGQWGGGDSKMLMGLGALIGINIILPIKDNITNWINNPPLILIFLILTLLVGAIYGIFWCIGLAIINRKQFLIEIKKILIKPKIKIVKIICFIIMVVLFTLSFFTNDKSISLILIIFAFLCGFLFYISIFVKAIEKTSMIKKINPKKLTEGDWIAEDVIINNKLIAGPKDLGVEKKQINTLIKLYKQKKIPYVVIKEGIPFVPSFLISFILSIIIYLLY